MFCSAVTYIFTSTRNVSRNKLKKYSAVVHGLQSQTTRDRMPTALLPRNRRKGGREKGRASGKLLNFVCLFLYLKREEGKQCLLHGAIVKIEGVGS